MKKGETLAPDGGRFSQNRNSGNKFREIIFTFVTISRKRTTKSPNSRHQLTNRRLTCPADANLELSTSLSDS